MTDPKNPKDLDNDFEDFVSKDSQAFVPNEKVLATKRKLEEALVPSASRIARRYVGISIVGYLLSLMICSQNGFGFFEFSDRIAIFIHRVTAPYSDFSCGALFSVVPFLLSSFVLNRFEQRYLLTKLAWLVALLPAIAALAMYIVPPLFGRAPEHSGFLAVVWVVAATVTPYLLDLVAYWILKQGAFRNLYPGRK